ncbi:MAG: hypothetical protein JSU04_13380 [Bdellovibrionales bacterium]|nr:hypothetical protein [Bdellovibrionales bacterium]
MNVTRFKIFENDGQVLIQVLLAMGIFAFLIASFMSMVSSQRKDIKYNQALTARGLLELRLEKYLTNSAALDKTRKLTSFEGNVKFNACYSSTGTVCTQTLQPAGFQLVDPNGTVVAGGSPDAPIRYNSRGEICPAVSDDCLFEVFSYFTAACPGGTATCSRPSSFNATYTIQQAAGANPLGGLVMKTFTSSLVPVGSPPYNLVPYTRSFADGTGTFPIGAHDFCVLNQYIYDGDGVGNCMVTGAKKDIWTITIQDEGDAQVQTCGVLCIDFL